ncbi:ribosome maturation factor RimM [Bacteroidota bacterium]
MSQHYLIAQIKSIYGCEGFVSIISYSDALDRFKNLREVFIEVFGAKREFFVDKTDFINNQWLLKFKNFNSDQDVKFLVGKKVYIEKKDLANLPNDTFYIHDLIGSKVYSDSKFFGYLIDVLVLKSNDVYVIEREDGKEVLIPALKDYIIGFDTAKKRLDLVSVSEIFLDDEN